MSNEEVAAQAVVDQREAALKEMLALKEQLDALTQERGRLTHDDVIGKEITVDAFTYFDLLALASALIEGLVSQTGFVPPNAVALTLGRATLAGTKALFG